MNTSQRRAQIEAQLKALKQPAKSKGPSTETLIYAALSLSTASFLVFGGWKLIAKEAATQLATRQEIAETERSLQDIQRTEDVLMQLDAIARRRMNAGHMFVSMNDRSKYVAIAPGVRAVDPETGAVLSNITMVDVWGNTAVLDENGYPTEIAAVQWDSPEEHDEWLSTRLGADAYRAVVSNMAAE